MPRSLIPALLAALSACGPNFEPTAPFEVEVSQQALTQVTGFGSNPGSLSLYLYAPAQLPASPAVVFALHGCTQSATAYELAGWDGLADQYHFLVAYPQTTASNDCFDWYDSAQQARTGAQVTSVLQMVTWLEQNRGVDASRVFVTGLSAGGAMTNVLLATASDVFTRGAVMAGLPFGCATNQTDAFTCMNSPPDKTPAQWGALVRSAAPGRPAPRVSLWHGASDTTVRPANLAEERDQWVDVNGIDATADATTTVGRATHAEYRDAAGNTLVETWSVSSMNHGTPVDPANGCGTAGAFILDVGLCSSRLAAQFFGLVPAGSGTGGGSGSGGGSGTGGGSAGACQEWFDTNVNHFSAQRAVLCNARYCAKGSNELLGDSLDQTWVNQTEPAIFHAGRCGGSGTGGGVSGSGGGASGTGGGASGTGGGTSGTGGGGEPTTTPGGCSAAPVSALGLGLLTAMRALRRRRGSREQRAGASPADRATSSTKSRSASHQQLVDQRSA